MYICEKNIVKNKETTLTLANGTKLCLSPADSSASYVGLFVASGSRHDGTTLGVSHLIEHAIFKGTDKHSYSELMNMVESVGGEINAYTAKEETAKGYASTYEYYEDGELVGETPIVREEPKVGRNDPCPCGSGKKFKNCHGKGL